MMKRGVSVKDVFVGAADWRLLLNVGCILFFIQLLEATGILHQIITCFEGSALPVPVIIALTSFVIGILTGMSQGHVAIVMPIVAGLMPGSLDLAGVAMFSSSSRPGPGSPGLPDRIPDPSGGA